jgi:DNA primase
MKDVLQDILSRERIAEYLEARGVDVQVAGSRMRCSCPLPGHEETHPSFYIGQFDDGADYFKCFGCSRSGNFISLLKLMESKSSKQVIHELCQKHGVKPGAYVPSVKSEPLPHEIMAAFCEEDALASDITTLARSYLRSRDGCEDAVNKVSRLYRRLDELNAKGDMIGMSKLMGDLKALLSKEGRSKVERDEK